MRLRLNYTAVLLALCCVEGALGRAAPAQQRRDDVSSITSSAAPSSSTHDASSSAPQSDKSTASAHSSSQTHNSHHSSSSMISVTSSVSHSSTASATSSEAATASATSAPDALPIEPSITPALGIAGVFLMIAGVALTLIGIKHKWLHIFLSVMLLTALAVSVLIVYVMDPPVSNAIQGAYFVAAFMTGVIFGAVSLIFKDVTEGFGCLLGGFCMAMWFLVLREGGLVQSTVGRAIMIGVFCVVGWGLAFSHYTRNYGLIIMTSFAGATTTILGIDCFSKAGLKEFWLYLWNLNDQEFPIGTNTYPITRGIRVEIACTIVIFLIGIMSQVKIWRVVKERRAKREEERARDGLSKEQQEEARGRELEKTNERDLAQWEAVYGDKTGTQTTQTAVGSDGSFDSGNGKQAESVNEREIEELEMEDLPKRMSKRASKRMSGLTTKSGSGGGSPRVPAESEENLLDTAQEGHGEHTGPSTQRNSEDSNSLRASSACISERRRSVRDGPEVTPLPFSIPGQHAPPAAKSETTVGPSASMRAGSEAGDDEEDDIPHIEDDRASSVAAIVDDEDDLSDHRMSAVPHPYNINPAKVGPISEEKDETPAKEFEAPVAEDDDEALIRSPIPQEQPMPPSPQSPKRRSVSGPAPGRKSFASQRDDEDGNASAVGSLTGHLPHKLSKIAMTYRTNEWAKHITEADRPEHDEVRSTSPGIQVDPVFAEEAARPVDVEDLAPAPPSTIQDLPSKNPERSATNKSKASRRSSSGATTPLYSYSKNASQMSLNQKNSQRSLNQKGSHMSLNQKNSQMSLRRMSSGTDMMSPTKLATRNISGPIASQTLVESPTEENMDFSGPYRNSSFSNMGSISASNLLDQREAALKQRPTTTSFNSFSPEKTQGPADSAFFMDRDSSEKLYDEENMTLSERKSLMNLRSQMQTPITSPTRQMSGGGRDSRLSLAQTPGRMSSVGSLASPQQNAIIYDSHQPQRGNTIDSAKQSATLAQWRQSLHTENIVRSPVNQHDTAQQALLDQRRQDSYNAQRKQADRQRRESVMEQAMRTGQLNDAHRDALRRMQAKANKS